MFPPKFIFHSPVFSKQLSVQIVVKMQAGSEVRKVRSAWPQKSCWGVFGGCLCFFFFLSLALFSNNAQPLRGEQKYSI